MADDKIRKTAAKLESAHDPMCECCCKFDPVAILRAELKPLLEAASPFCCKITGCKHTIEGDRYCKIAAELQGWLEGK